MAMKASMFALGLWCGLITVSFAQKVESINPAAKSSEKHGKKEASAPIPVDSTPSRFAGKDTSTYTLARAAVFSMAKREIDPFGLNQDPSIKPAPKKVIDRLPEKRLAALPPTPLGDIVKLIRVTTIMPGEKKFLVGVRTFSEGDDFSLLFQGKRMRMEVTEVSATRIVFTNLENSEKASLETGILPSGMVAGKGTMKPAGMVSPVDDLPLDLGSPLEEVPNN
ncbi:MAG: hypothetical protein RLZZ505_1678 [Verrucomicrobiota bacterium]|jgi:hypothetical protein